MVKNRVITNSSSSASTGVVTMVPPLRSLPKVAKVATASTPPSSSLTKLKRRVRSCNKEKSGDEVIGVFSKRSKKPVKTRMNRFCVGQHVDIRRSDGRVHGAVIVGFADDEDLVKVEWYEEGETKGKEVDIQHLLKMNPILNSYHEPEPPAKKPATKTAVVTAPLEVTKPLTRVKTTTKPLSLDSSVPNSNNNKNMRRPMPTEKNAGKNGVTTSPQKTSSKPKHEPSKASRQKENFEPNGYDAISDSLSVKQHRESHRDREDRRIRDSEAKRQKYLKNEVDKSNANWQFLAMINEYRSTVDFRPISPSDDVVDNSISVCIRKRPLDKREVAKKEIDVVTIPNKDHVVVHQPQTKVDLTKYLENQKFRFDYAFDEDCDNEIVYQFTAQPLIRTVFDGGFATCFAYGQTGSGKTHTMSGAFHGKTQDYTAGIYNLTAEDVFKRLSLPEYHKLRLIVKCSFFEIYGSKVFDLLGKRTELRILEDEKRSVQVVGLSEVTVNSPEDVMDLIKQGSAQRSAGTTSANANSSRSHAVFQFILRRGTKEEVHGKFSLIDLAGNERGADTNSSDKQTRREGAEINKSLLALKECIRAMAMNKAHLPFRYSKLTLVLRDSFNNENAKTCMIGMVSPGLNSVENTLNTLRYADRVKELGSDEEGLKPVASDADFMLEEIEEDEYYSKPIQHVKSQHALQKMDSFDDNLATKVRNAEGKTFEDHHALLTVCDKFEELMQSQNDTDNDIEKYAKQLIVTCERGTEAMSNLRDSAKDLLSKIQKERDQTNKKRTGRK